MILGNLMIVHVQAEANGTKQLWNCFISTLLCNRMLRSNYFCEYKLSERLFTCSYAVNCKVITSKLPRQRIALEICQLGHDAIGDHAPSRADKILIIRWHH